MIMFIAVNKSNQLQLKRERNLQFTFEHIIKKNPFVALYLMDLL